MLTTGAMQLNFILVLVFGIVALNLMWVLLH